jgi:hypothetical protein
MGTPDIVEAQAVGHIRAKISSSLYICDSLCRKYHEVKTKEKKEPDGKIVPAEYTPLYKCIMAFREELIGKYSLNGTNVTKRLEELMQLELAQIAVKHKLMDRLDSKEVWEEEVSKKFFLD